MSIPPLAVEQPDGSRLYRHPKTEETVPSITTIMKEGIAKPRLTGAATRLAAEYADGNWAELSELHPYYRVEQIRYAHDREWDKARKLGTQVHEAIDAWCSGVPHEPAKEIAPYLNSFISFMLTMRPCFAENETTVWSRTHGYAGTFDWLAEINGDIYLGDTKTGKRVYEETGLQLAALANAEFILREDGTEEPMPAFDYLAVLHIRPRGWKLIPVHSDAENFRAFLACRELYSWVHEVAPGVLGRAA